MAPVRHELPTAPTIDWARLPVACSFSAAAEPSGRLVICLPGRGYRSTMPLLYYPLRLLRDAGADTVSVDYAYDAESGFRAIDEVELEARLRRDVAAVLDRLFAERSYADIVVLGKSLGTVAMSLVLGEDGRLARARAIWLTPLIKNPRVFARMLGCPQRGLAVIGMSDSHYDAGLLETLERSGFSTMAVAGADHGLERAADTAGSLKILERVLERIGQFIGLGAAATAAPGRIP
jgi:hypothetical protein